jgi:hypothetical protein
MTAKEKAEELVNKYYDVEVISADWGASACINAKECALITVDEIEKEIHTYYERFEYWQEVKQEIEKL